MPTFVIRVSVLKKLDFMGLRRRTVPIFSSVFTTSYWPGFLDTLFNAASSAATQLYYIHKVPEFLSLRNSVADP